MPIRPWGYEHKTTLGTETKCLTRGAMLSQHLHHLGGDRNHSVLPSLGGCPNPLVGSSPFSLQRLTDPKFSVIQPNGIPRQTNQC